MFCGVSNQSKIYLYIYTSNLTYIYQLFFSTFFLITKHTENAHKKVQARLLKKQKKQKKKTKEMEKREEKYHIEIEMSEGKEEKGKEGKEGGGKRKSHIVL